MPELNINIGSSQLKREARDVEVVIKKLKRNGWTQSGSLGDRVLYFENTGMSITVIDGPMGTLVVPSGPVRGRLFGSSGLRINKNSVLDLSSDSDTDKDRQEKQAKRRNERLT